MAEEMNHGKLMIETIAGQYVGLQKCGLSRMSVRFHEVYWAQAMQRISRV